MFNLFMLIGCWIVYGIMKAHEKAELARKLPPKPTKPYNLDRQLELLDWCHHSKTIYDGTPFPDDYKLVNKEEEARRQLNKEGYAWMSFGGSYFDLENYIFDKEGYIVGYTFPTTLKPQRERTYSNIKHENDKD